MNARNTVPATILSENQKRTLALIHRGKRIPAVDSVAEGIAQIVGEGE